MSKVVIACKAPNGINLMGVIINGANARKTNEPSTVKMAAGYALTENVDADLWKQWSETHADSDLVQRQLIFACDTIMEAHVKARSLGGM